MENKELSKKKRATKEVGKVLVNFGNLTFASLVLGTIIKGDFNQFALLIVGVGIAVLFIALGIVLLTSAGGE
jgi:hypothetical protein